MIRFLLAAALWLMACVAPVAAQSALAQVGGNVPGSTLGNKSDSDFWRDIKKGQKGNVSNPSAQWEQLIAGEVFACSKDKICSEKAVGFALPIHANMPAIEVKQGVGVGMPILLLLGAFFMAGFAWAGWLLMRLGKDEAADASIEG